MRADRASVSVEAPDIVTPLLQGHDVNRHVHGFFTPTLTHLAGIRLIECIGDIPKTHEFIRQNAFLAQPLKATLDYVERLAARAGHLILHGDTERALSLCKAEPLILTCRIEVKDHKGRRAIGTLLQIAAMAGDCNVRRKQGSELDHGLVEQLALLIGVESVNQIQAIRPLDWKNATKFRMQAYRNVAAEFINDLVDIVVPPDATYEMVLLACQLPIDKFLKALDNINAQQEVITTGLIFDLRVLVHVSRLIYGSYKRFHESWHAKTELFMRIGFGNLQLCASACDIQAFSTGLHRIKHKKGLPDRSIQFTDGVPPSLLELGIQFYIDSSGNHQSDSQKTSPFEFLLFKNYQTTKKNNMKIAVQATERHFNPSCQIL
jgi:hypothetical protein